MVITWHYIVEVVPLEKLISWSENIEDYQLRTIFYILYLTGARISEVLALRKKDITIEEMKGIKVVIFNMINLKNKTSKFKKQAIPAITPEIKWMLKVILYYINDLEDDKKIFYYTRNNVTTRYRKLPPLHLRATSKETGKVIDNCEFKMHPHYLRHCRLTHLEEEHDLGAFKLTIFAGWSDTKPARTYVHTSWKSLVKAMMKKD